MQELFITISGLTDDGRGVARHDGKVYFVHNALPGQQVVARITRVKKHFAEAQCLRVVENMPHVAEAICPHREECGGCPLQSMPYTDQLTWKQRLVRDAFARIGGLKTAHILDVVPSPCIAGFRNKMEFAFGEDEEGKLILGLRKRASRTVLNIKHCALLPEGGMRILHTLRDLAASSPYGAQHFSTDGRGRSVHIISGLWRFAILRYALDARGSAGWWVHIITGAADAAAQLAVRKVGMALLQSIPEIKGFVHDVRLKADMLAQGEQRIAVLGKSGAELMQNLDGLSLKLDISSFYQVHSTASHLLCQEAKKAAALEHMAAPVLWDLYCGSGAPGLALAQHCAQLLGIEYDAKAVARAQENARLQGYTHCQYKAGDVEKVLQSLAHTQKLCVPDVVLVDPPRAGMAEGVVQRITTAKPARIVYISCNPATLARDAGLIHSQGYALQYVQPVDMFPHTPHVENVALFEAV